MMFLNPNHNMFLYFVFFLKGTHCGGYNGGRSAMEHAAEGLFDNAIETTWTRGENTEVFWASGGRHRGGYAYRLCKVPGGDITKVSFSSSQRNLIKKNFRLKL